MKKFSLRKVLLRFFAIIETTERGKKWERLDASQNAKWVWSEI